MNIILKLGGGQQVAAGPSAGCIRTVAVESMDLGSDSEQDFENHSAGSSKKGGLTLTGAYSNVACHEGCCGSSSGAVPVCEALTKSRADGPAASVVGAEAAGRAHAVEVPSRGDRLGHPR